MNKSFVVQIVSFIFPFLPFTSFACNKKPGGELQSFQFYYSDGYYHVLPAKGNVTGTVDIVDMSVVGCTNLDNSSRILAADNYSNVYGVMGGGEECAELYGKPDCHSRRPLHVDPSLIQEEVRSFHLCSWNRFHDFIDYSRPSQAFPGPQYQLLLYNNTGFRDFLMGYNTNVEECQNLPQKADKKVSSIFMEGYHCLQLYQDKFCQGASYKLFNNHSNLDTRRNLDRVFWNNRTSSIRTCGPSLQSLITTFKPLSMLKAPKNRERDPNLRKIEIAPPQSFSNNGTASTWTIYEGRRTFNETFIFERIESFKTFQKVVVKNNISVDGGTNINWNGTLYPHLCFPVESVSRCIAAKRIEDELTKVYQFLSDKDKESQERLMSTSRTGEILRDFSVKKNVTVPPCTISEVTSYILVNENISLTFELGARIQGENRGQRMTAQQLRDNLPPRMVYLKDLGAYEIFVKVGAIIVANVGVKSAISVRKRSLPDCGRKEHLTAVELILEYKTYVIVVGVIVLIMSIIIMCMCSRLCVNRIERGGGKGKKFDLIKVGGHVLRIEVFGCSKLK